MKNYNIGGHCYEDSESFGLRCGHPRQCISLLRLNKAVLESITKRTIKSLLKNRTIKNVVTRLAVSTIVFFLIAPMAYSHPSGPRLDSNGGHIGDNGKYHQHMTPKEVLQLIEETRRLEKEKQEKENLRNEKQIELLELLNLLEKQTTQKQLVDENGHTRTAESQTDRLDLDQSKDAARYTLAEALKQQIDRLDQQIKVLDRQTKVQSLQVTALPDLPIRPDFFLPPTGDKGKQETEKKDSFLGAKFGLGVGLMHGLGPRSVEATLDENGIINVSEDKTRAINFFLETHYYPDTWRFGRGNIAHGPFVLMNTGAIDTDADTLATFGVGWMLGVRVSDKAINVGAGYALQTGVQSLRSNFVAGKEAPRDDMGTFIEPQYTKSTEGAWVILVSFAAF